MTFGEKLKTLRTEAGLSQKALAVSAGLAQTAIGHWETGVRSPSWENVRAVCRVLQVPCTVFEVCEVQHAVNDSPRPKGRPKKPAPAPDPPPTVPIRKRGAK